MLWGVVLNLPFTPQLSHGSDFILFLFSWSVCWALAGKENVFCYLLKIARLPRREYLQFLFFFFPAVLLAQATGVNGSSPSQ